jgi:hypothetical protein
MRMVVGWFAIAAAILTVMGAVTLVAFFQTGSPVLGTVNDLTTIALACATIPIALELHGLASRTSAPVATAALVVDVVGVALAAVFSALLVARVMSFERTLAQITIGNGLIGVWVAITAALLFFGAAVPPLVGRLGVAGGAGLAVASMAFPLLGREHRLVAGAGALAVLGLVPFYAWIGVLMLQRSLGAA